MLYRILDRCHSDYCKSNLFVVSFLSLKVVQQHIAVKTMFSLQGGTLRKDEPHGFHLTLTEPDTAIYGKDRYPYALLGDYSGKLVIL